MKIFDLLNETPEQQYDLHRIAEYIAMYIKRSSPRANEVSSSPTFSEPLLKIVPENILNGLKSKFRDIEIRVRYVSVSSAPSVKLRSQYMPGMDFISLAVPVDEQGNISNEDEIASSLVHEFRHALDSGLIKDSLKNKTAQDINIVMKQPVKGTKETLSNSELNAKFSQSVHYLIGLVNSNKVTRDNLKQSIMQTLKKFGIIDAFRNPTENKKFRHLFNQLYKFGNDAMQK